MTDIYIPLYDPLQDYYSTVCDDVAPGPEKQFNLEILAQIDRRLGDNQWHRKENVIEKNLNLDDDKRNRFWYDWVVNNIKKLYRKKHQMSMKTMMATVESLNKPQDTEPIWAFITVGFDDAKIAGNVDLFHSRVRQICAAVANKSYGKDAVKSVEYVIEKHRKDEAGETYIHHHCHFLFVFNKKVPPSDMRNKIWATAGIKEFVAATNFIQYDGPQKPRRAGEKPLPPFLVLFNYIRGDKTPQKLSCIEKDRFWRNEVGIEHLYCV